MPVGLGRRLELGLLQLSRDEGINWISYNYC
jgi:hypothetical protein